MDIPSPPVPRSALIAMVAFLRATFPGVQAGTIVANPRPQQCFKVTLTGMGPAPEGEPVHFGYVDTAVRVEYYDEDAVRAESTMRLVFASITDMNSDEFWFIDWLEAMNYNEDNIAEIPRYECTAIIRSQIEGT